MSRLALFVAPGERLRSTRRIAQLLIGLFLYGIAIALMVRAGIGVSPWDVLTQGLVHQTGLPFGLLTNLIGVVVLLLWIPIRQKPGVKNSVAKTPKADLPARSRLRSPFCRIRSFTAPSPAEASRRRRRRRRAPATGTRHRPARRSPRAPSASGARCRRA